MSAADLRRPLDRLAKAIEGNDDVLGDLSPALGGHRDRDPVPPGPQLANPARVVQRRRRRQRSLGEHLAELGGDATHLVRIAVGFGEHGEGRLRRGGKREGADAGPQRRRVEELQRGRLYAVADHRHYRLAAGPDTGVEGGDDRLCRGGGNESQPGGRDDGQRPLRAGEEADQVIAGDVLADRAAEQHHLAARQHCFQAGDPVAGDAVLEGVRPAGVGRDVAADRRLLGGAGIGGEEEPVLAGEALHVGGSGTSLHLHSPQPRVEDEDPRSSCRGRGRRPRPVRLRRRARSLRREGRSAPGAPRSSASPPRLRRSSRVGQARQRGRRSRGCRCRRGRPRADASLRGPARRRAADRPGLLAAARQTQAGGRRRKGRCSSARRGTRDVSIEE